MFKEGDPSKKHINKLIKWTAASFAFFNKFYGKMSVAFCLNT